MCQGDHKHIRKKLRSDISACLSEENEFEWNPHSNDDHCVAKELVSIHNQKFKNNEQPAYRYQDYMLNNVDLYEVDTSALFFNDDHTCSTASLSTDDESVGIDDLTSNSQNNNLNDFEDVYSESSLTGNAQNDHFGSMYDTDEDTVPDDIDCHAIEDTEFDLYY